MKILLLSAAASFFSPLAAHAGWYPVVQCEAVVDSSNFQPSAKRVQIQIDRIDETAQSNPSGPFSELSFQMTLPGAAPILAGGVLGKTALMSGEEIQITQDSRWSENNPNLTQVVFHRRSKTLSLSVSYGFAVGAQTLTWRAHCP